MSWNNIVKHAMNKPGKLAKVTGKKALKYGKEHPYKTAAIGGTGALGIAALSGGDNVEEQAIDLYNQGKSAEEIQQLLPDLPPEVLQNIIKSAEYNKAFEALMQGE